MQLGAMIYFASGKRPFARFVPDLIARQPSPRRLDSEDAAKAGRIPSAGRSGAALAPQAQSLPFQEVRTVLERREHSRLGRHGRVTRHQPRFELIHVVRRLQPIAQHQRAPESHDLNPVCRIAALVVALDDWNLDAQEPALPRLAVEQAHA